MEVLSFDTYLNDELIRDFYSAGLVGFDYLRDVTFNMAWNQARLTARGLVFDELSHDVVCRGYDKFFNLQEPYIGGVDGLKSHLGDVDINSFDALEKADGSMISMFYHDNKFKFMTRGSFQSDQALWAERISVKYNFNRLNPSYTYIFEAIYPDNRIVVDYGGLEELRMTGIRHTKTGEFVPYDEMVAIAVMIGCSVVKRFDLSTIEDALALVNTFDSNQEGLVLRYKNGFMVKVKSAAYCALHKTVSNITPLAYWRAMDLDTLTIPNEFLYSIPEEFREDSDAIVSALYAMVEDKLSVIKGFAESVPTFPNTHEGNFARYTYIKALSHEYLPLILMYKLENIKMLYKKIHALIRPKNNVILGLKLSNQLAKIMDNVE